MKEIELIYREKVAQDSKYFEEYSVILLEKTGTFSRLITRNDSFCKLFIIVCLFVYSSMSFASMSVNEDESAYGGSQSGISSQRSSMQGSIHILRKRFQDGGV